MKQCNHVSVEGFHGNDIMMLASHLVPSSLHYANMCVYIWIFSDVWHLLVFFYFSFMNWIISFWFSVHLWSVVRKTSATLTYWQTVNYYIYNRQGHASYVITSDWIQQLFLHPVAPVQISKTIHWSIQMVIIVPCVSN